MITNIFITSGIDISTDGRRCGQRKESWIPQKQVGKNNSIRNGWPTSDNLVCFNLGKTIGVHT